MKTFIFEKEATAKNLRNHLSIKLCPELDQLVLQIELPFASFGKHARTEEFVEPYLQHLYANTESISEDNRVIRPAWSPEYSKFLFTVENVLSNQKTGECISYLDVNMSPLMWCLSHSGRKTSETFAHPIRQSEIDAVKKIYFSAITKFYRSLESRIIVVSE